MSDKEGEITRNYRPLLHGYASFVAVCTFVLIIAGALVTSNDAGLSVPDWPTSFGTFHMPRMVGGIKFEHGHRMIAGVVGILTILLALWLWRVEERRWVRRLGALAVLAVVAQALLGGITVLFYLPVDVSVAHACLAQLFFCIVVSLAVFTGRDWTWDENKIADPHGFSTRKLAVWTTVAAFLQLMMGAFFRHQGFGIGPHVVGAVVVTVGVIWLLMRIFGTAPAQPKLSRQAILVGALLALQLGLGITAYFLKMANIDAPQPEPPVVDITTAHVALGALLLAATFILTLRVFRYLAPAGAVKLAGSSEVGLAGSASPR